MAMYQNSSTHYYLKQKKKKKSVKPQAFDSKVLVALICSTVNVPDSINMNNNLFQSLRANANAHI